MTVHKLSIFPAPILRQRANEVEQVTEEIRALLDDMAETMYFNDGVGLAAPQIGIGLRLAVIDIRELMPGQKEGDSTLIKMVNPVIESAEGEIDWEEGCLSVPGFTYIMKRKSKLTVRYLDENGKKKILKAEGLLAVACQQEIDHLDGKLIIDNISPLKQDMYLRKRKKEEAG